MTETQKDYKKEMGKLRSSIGSISEGVAGTQATIEDSNDAINRVAEAIEQHRLELSGITVEIRNLRDMFHAAMEDLAIKISVIGGSK